MARPKNKKYRPKPIRIPVTALHGEMALHLHAALATLRYQPSIEAFDMIAGILNMIQVTIENDERFIHEAKLINGGAATLNQVSRKIESGQTLQEFELGSVQVAVNTVDSILTRLDVTRMHLAQLTVRRLLRAQESEQIRSLH